jgi:hypothetical protein
VKRTATVALLALYAWWASGVAPFTTLAYVLIAIPSLLMVVSYGALGALSPRRADIARYYRRRSGDASFATTSPWLAILVVAVVLEAVGLALGGRSRDVATLSTAVDHLLVAHWGRGLLYLAWLAIGARPIYRLWRRRRDVAP